MYLFKTLNKYICNSCNSWLPVGVSANYVLIVVSLSEPHTSRKAYAVTVYIYLFIFVPYVHIPCIECFLHLAQRILLIQCMSYKQIDKLHSIQFGCDFVGERERAGCAKGEVEKMQIKWQSQQKSCWVLTLSLVSLGVQSDSDRCSWHSIFSAWPLFGVQFQQPCSS